MGSYPLVRVFQLILLRFFAFEELFAFKRCYYSGQLCFLSSFLAVMEILALVVIPYPFELCLKDLYRIVTLVLVRQTFLTKSLRIFSCRQEIFLLMDWSLQPLCSPGALPPGKFCYHGFLR
ncbi:unnamed protein product [Chrysodeixis includens]|uniref:Uncharacterized protein n=1 Tax=Chrysodeixis includens TaxID=689277 RepID=A0A9N8L1I4_CHRIL|nr:unnamed protein product [Chrysodeixis includens]